MAIKNNRSYYGRAMGVALAGALAGKVLKSGRERFLQSQRERHRKGNMVGGDNNAARDTRSVRFNDMGDRGGVNTTFYRKRKRLPTKTRKRLKRFRKKVLKVSRPKQSINTLQTTWLGTGFAVVAATPDSRGSTTAGNVQTIWGNSDHWGINIGEKTTGGLIGESELINTEMGRYAPRINGADIAKDDNEQRDSNAHWIQRKYHKLTVHNPNTAIDLIFDLYECVAAQDIADPNFKNPVSTWIYLNDAQKKYATAQPPLTNPLPGEIWIKGTEPTDLPNFGKYWKIIKKSSVRIPAANPAINSYQTFKMYSPKFLYKGWKFNDKVAIKGKTKYWMMVVEPEQMVQRYITGNSVMTVLAHINTHYKPTFNLGGLHQVNSVPNYIRSNIGAPAF